MGRHSGATKDIGERGRETIPAGQVWVQGDGESCCPSVNSSELAGPISLKIFVHVKGGCQNVWLNFQKNRLTFSLPCIVGHFEMRLEMQNIGGRKERIKTRIDMEATGMLLSFVAFHGWRRYNPAEEEEEGREGERVKRKTQTGVLGHPNDCWIIRAEGACNGFQGEENPVTYDTATTCMQFVTDLKSSKGCCIIVKFPPFC